MSKNNQDTAWKDLLQAYFKECLDYFFPRLSAEIDWERSYQALDKEFSKATKSVDPGKRIADKLFKVYRKSGEEQWIVIHVEIQGKREKDFETRMFGYWCRISEEKAHKVPVVSCILLTDANKSWRPSRFEVSIGGFCSKTEFLVAKMLDFGDRIEELDASNDIFACVIYTQLLAIKSRSKPADERKALKLALTRRLYSKGFDKKAIRALYRFIDWLIGLPESLEIQYNDEMLKFEESKTMAYVTSAERIGRKKGKREGIQEGILQGIARGIEQGIEQGVEQEKLVIAERLIARGADVRAIAEITELDLDAVKKLKRKKLH